MSPAPAPGPAPLPGETIGAYQTRTGCAPLPPTWQPAYDGDDGFGPEHLPEPPPPATGPQADCFDSLGRPIPWMADWQPAYKSEPTPNG